jgi:thiamine biosynthesis protein ThiS
MRAAEGRFLVAAPRHAHTSAMSDSTAAQATFTVNGETRPFTGPTTVSDLLAALGLDGRKVAVECNEAIVPRSAYAATRLEPGDSLEIVHFIGGG